MNDDYDGSKPRPPVRDRTGWLVQHAKPVVVFLFGCVIALVVVVIFVIAGRQAANAPKTTQKLDAAQETLTLLKDCLVQSKDPDSCYQKQIRSQAASLGKVAISQVAAASYAEACARQLVAKGVRLESLPDAISACVFKEFAQHGAPLPTPRGGVPSGSPSPSPKG